VHCYVCLWSSLSCGFSSFGLVAEVTVYKKKGKDFTFFLFESFIIWVLFFMKSQMRFEIS
jgi:hypothetical protein